MKLPEGWQLVPIEPTEQMLYDACAASLSTGVLLDDTRFACERALWKAALARARATPFPPEVAAWLKSFEQ